MSSDFHKNHMRHVFDSYCKRVLINEANNGHRELNRRCRRETPLSMLSEHSAKKMVHYDDYLCNYSSFQVGRNSILISNDCLATALERLPPKDRDIILMYWFLDMSDREIALQLGMNRKTVNTHRRKAIFLIKKLMGGEVIE